LQNEAYSAIPDDMKGADRESLEVRLSTRPGHGSSPSSLHVCSLNRMPETLARTGAQHLITLINQQTMPPTPEGILVGRHLRIGVNDIIEPADGLVHPCQDHVVELLRFATSWNRQGPLVVHCYAGISRSSAAAFIVACALNPDVPERLIARQLREASPTANPNGLLVRLADDHLNRRGRMLVALESIGPAEFASEAEPFMLASRFD
jgi:predicted protein tyrosine phosphatase